ncbi:PASTA domain-containing protein [Amycolatopsis sp. YIM 10]|uniref:PASTA domain-containing protein n=1 Tax=Amycolatopsis sp. YIM 10 TaxID=2653857 RepID=UPI0012902B5B|nr:PASTA domain-containing protein [Amycolatopsis sp. YIM 10]QFU92446.1 PASTA domain protein [Amycolatopsis sp. YIM 10]
MTGPVRGACLVLGALLLASCGGAPPAPTSTPAPAPASSAAASAGETPAATITVPDVSGMNHQDAQNTMQAAGLYNLREVDGKGLGRALLVDRNWVQTGQSPPAGTKVPPDAVITLTAVKYTD